MGIFLLVNLVVALWSILLLDFKELNISTSKGFILTLVIVNIPIINILLLTFLLLNKRK